MCISGGLSVWLKLQLKSESHQIMTTIMKSKYKWLLAVEIFKQKPKLNCTDNRRFIFLKSVFILS